MVDLDPQEAALANRALQELRRVDPGKKIVRGLWDWYRTTQAHYGANCSFCDDVLWVVTYHGKNFGEDEGPKRFGEPYATQCRPKDDETVTIMHPMILSM